jgi:carbamoyltransferase
MRVLGISPAHDSSVCLYEDGKIVSFYKEERLSKKKKDKLPILAVQKVLEGVNHIDLAVYCGVIKDKYQFDHFGLVLNKFVKCDNFIDFSDSHHLQHASLAFYNSGFETASVIIVDRNGSVVADSTRESETIFSASYPANFKEVYKSLWVFDNSAHVQTRYLNQNSDCEYDAKSMFGIVKVYESATTLIGQNILENGKTMGLSAYGEKVDGSRLFVKGTNIPNDFYLGHDENYESINYDLDPHRVFSVDEDNYQMYADYAWQVQEQTQEAVAYLIEKSVEKTGNKNIVISGGYGLNVVANRYYIDRFPELNFYFEPLADDTGNSIGGAMLFYRQNTGDMEIRPLKHTFFHGSEQGVGGSLGPKVSIRDIAEMICSNKSVAIFQGKAEAGPRALGHRSILFNAMNDDAKKIVNRIKKREWYRPFAAAVLEEDADQYFDMAGITAPFMTVSFPAKELACDLFKGIVHVDGTCRIQTVNKDIPTLYALLQEIKSITGHGIVLNTSFNLAGEPLVESMSDAIKTLQNSELDVLWFPDVNNAIIKE